MMSRSGLFVGILSFIGVGVLSICADDVSIDDSAGTIPQVESASSEKVIVLSPFVVDLSSFPDRTREEWDALLARIHLGMTRAEVLSILPEVPYCVFTTITGGANCSTYAIDSSWSVVMCFDHQGTRLENRLIQFPVLRPGGWKDPAGKKTGEPGATDNPDDAQRLREDH